MSHKCSEKTKGDLTVQGNLKVDCNTKIKKNLDVRGTITSECRPVALVETETLHVVMQLTDIFEIPFGDTFQIIAQVQKTGKTVSVTIPSFNAEFPVSSSEGLPAGYPLGGFIITVSDPLPVKYRHNYALPIATFVSSDNVSASQIGYIASIDRFGRITFTGPNAAPINSGPFNMLGVTVTYVIKGAPQPKVSNFAISNGFSTADVPVDRDFSLRFDFGEYDEITNGFLNGTLFAVWADNSSSLEFNTPNQLYKAYAVSKIEVNNNGRVTNIGTPINLDQTPGGEVLPANFTYAEGSVAINPANPNQVSVVYQQRPHAPPPLKGFVLSRSFDGGNTWTKKLIATGSSSDGLPIAGGDVHCLYDRFGGFYMISITGTISPPLALSYWIAYSSDNGETFSLLFQPTFPSGFIVDYGALAVGPDAQNLSFDNVYYGFDLFDNVGGNSYQMYGFQIRGLGLANISSPTAFNISDDIRGVFGSIAVGTTGQVFVGLHQGQLANPIATPQLFPGFNWRYYLYYNPNGLTGTFSSRREATYSANSQIDIPAQPNRGLEVMMSIAVDKSNIHPNRIYMGFSSDQLGFDNALKPYLTWSDDAGITWVSPILLADNPQASTSQFNITNAIAIDPITGNLAATWYDCRGDPTNTKVRRFGVIINGRDLPNLNPIPLTHTKEIKMPENVKSRRSWRINS